MKELLTASGDLKFQFMLLILDSSDPARNSPGGNLLSHFSEKYIEIDNMSTTQYERICVVHIFFHIAFRKKIGKMTSNIIMERKY